MGRAANAYLTKINQSNALANTIASELLGGIKTVAAFTAQMIGLHNYTGKLHTSMSLAVKKSFVDAISFGAIHFVIFVSYGVGLYYGGYLIANEVPFLVFSDFIELLWRRHLGCVFLFFNVRSSVVLHCWYSNYAFNEFSANSNVRHCSNHCVYHVPNYPKEA
jgi:ABC-type multidrug transport system fused ATPase/permease subunit